MNWIFFLVFTVVGGFVTIGYFRPVSIRQFSIIIGGYLAAGLAGAWYIPLESTDGALIAVVLCFLTMVTIFYTLERDAQLSEWTGMEHGDTGRVRRPTD